MPAPELLLGGVLVTGLILYLVLGGADFGGGVWDLLAGGPRKQAQRELIERAIGPVWEANHVWLIFAAVVLFSAFPPAFAAISTALHIPLTLFLIGVVFRGSAFVFRSYDPDRRHRWGRAFSIASVVAPVLLGMTVGGIASGELRVRDGVVHSSFFAPWLGWFPFVLGLFALALCALLAATYLTYEAEDEALREDFRRRALVTAAAVGVLAFLALWLARTGAPRVYEGLTMRGWTLPFHAATGVAAITVFVALRQRRYAVARIAVGGQAALIVIGWALSQYPLIVVPDLTVQGAASNPKTLWALVWAIAAGLPILVPSLFVLFRVFKAPAVTGPGTRSRP